MFRDIIPARFRRKPRLSTELVGLITEPDPRHDTFDTAATPEARYRAERVADLVEKVKLTPTEPAAAQVIDHALIERARIRGVSIDPDPQIPPGGRITRVTPGRMEPVEEDQLRQDLGFTIPRAAATAGHGLSLDQLGQAEDWYLERLQDPPLWIDARRLDLARAQARGTADELDDVHVAFEDRLAAIDDRIVTSVRGVVDPPAQASEGRDLLERIGETLGEHVHVWDQVDRPGRHNWACSCSAVKCDLPRCIRPRHDNPPHHIRS